MDALLEARKKYNEAAQILRANAKDAINTACKAILNNPGVRVVSWSQKNSEYNDEGMYPGVWGPVINSPATNDPDDARPKWVYGYGNPLPDPRAKTLKETLEAIGEEILSELFGDACAVDARLVDGKVVYSDEYMDY